MEQKPEGTWRKDRWVVALSSLLVLGLVSGFFIFRQDHNNYFPVAVKKGIGFPLYYPTSLPSGYLVDRNSFQNPANGVVTFNILSPLGLKIGVSEEALPSDLDLSAKEQVPAGVRLPTVVFSTGIGQATIDQWGSNKVSYIVTDRTWIIINVTKLDDDTIRSITRSFSPV